MTDIIDLIDQATGCQQCTRPLGDSPSGDFCGPECQTEWYELRSEPLLDYSEPVDLAAHVHNLNELESPETTPEQPDHFSLPVLPTPWIREVLTRLDSIYETQLDQLFLYGQWLPDTQQSLRDFHFAFGNAPLTFEWQRADSDGGGYCVTHSFGGITGYINPPSPRTIEITPGRSIPLPDKPDRSSALQPDLPDVTDTGSFFYDEQGCPAVAAVTMPVVRVESLGSSGIPVQYRNHSTGPARGQRAPRTIRARGCQ